MRTRTVALIGEERWQRISDSSVLVVGVGGVGGYAVEMLARAGVGSITIIDGDKVDRTNINRQIIALESTVGKDKVEVFRDRILDINPACHVNAICARVTPENVHDIVSGDYDYIIDAIDSVEDKVALIVEAKRQDKHIISAMGAGNKYRDLSFKVTDIYKTKYDKLAKKMRRLLKEQHVSRLDVCYSETECEKVEGVIGSISYGPPLAGVTIAEYVLMRLMEREQ